MDHIESYINAYTQTEIELAKEIGEKLDDRSSLPQWLRYARLVPHRFLRQQLEKVCSLPDYKITTTRVRLFVHIIEKHLKYGDDNSWN